MIVKHLLHDERSFVKSYISYDYIQGLIGDQVERESLLRLAARVGGTGWKGEGWGRKRAKCTSARSVGKVGDTLSTAVTAS